MEVLTEKELAKREALKKKKPLVHEKILKLAQRAKEDIPTPVVDIAYNYACDLKCAHCSIAKMTPKKKALTPEKLYNLTEEFDKLGLCQLVLSGGEPLIFPDFDEVVKAMQPDKFHIKMSTHGRHLNNKSIEKIAKLGIDKVCVSLDEFHGISHNFASSKNYPASIQNLFIMKEYDIDPVMTTVVSKKNCRGEHLINLSKFASENDIRLDVYLAKPIGKWQNQFDIMIDSNDYEYLKSVHEKYPSMFLDTFPSYGIERKCGTIRSTIHITPYGDVFPCAFTQVSIGNVFEESLEEIINRAMKIKYFNKASAICLAGRNKALMQKISVNAADGTFPPTWKDVFINDFVE